jgi:hypothetical protein
MANCPECGNKQAIPLVDFNAALDLLRIHPPRPTMPVDEWIRSNDGCHGVLDVLIQQRIGVVE